MVKIKRLKDKQEFMDVLNMIYEDAVTYKHGRQDAINTLWKTIKMFQED